MATQGQPPQDVELQAPPSDGVSCLRFGSRSQLLVSSWDASLRVYEGAQLRMRVELEAPVLSCSYGKGDAEAFAGGLDCAVKQVDLNTRQTTALGTHEAAVRHVGYSREFGLAVSGGWDGAVKVFDVRNGDNAQIHEAKLPGKVFAMDVRSHLVAAATADRQVAVFDLRNFAQPLVRKESPLKYQMRCVSVFPDLTGYALASVEGRVALEYFEDEQEAADPAKKKRSYAFKCHRGKVDDQTLIYPVNSIAFHPTYGTFATGGCDGVVNLWDGANKKRITHLRQYPTSIAAMEFNHDGSVLAIAASYTYEQGEKEYVPLEAEIHPNDAIFLHTVQDSEVRPKKKAAA
ncbi:mitotic spindle checkpoint protein Bub3 [Phytophthora pseudosyringae]|uniref:Mitotic spindle checkpoint protein Bub3 n=1 Tax=Phytophthora pseudosyringae TaxID=221518 RepID=A0A8T1VPK1_9STRA|nr:mitotic spindle checkpoint protein Bub3 [Phytophthora pseudosyringae]